MRCPVCAGKYGKSEKRPSYWKSKQCPWCGSELVLPIPLVEVIVSTFGFITLLPFAVFLLDYMPTSWWTYLVMGLSALVCAIPGIFMSFIGEYSLGDGGFKRVLLVVLLASMEVLMLYQISKMPYYALGVYHEQTSNLITGGDDISGAMFSGSGDLVSFVRTDRVHGKSHSKLMVYNFLTHELREIAVVPDGSEVMVTAIVGDVESIHCDYRPDDNKQVRRRTLNLQTGRWTEGFRHEDAGYPAKRVSYDSFDNRYECRWEDPDEKYIWDNSTHQKVRIIKGERPNWFIWAPNKYRMVYQVSRVLPFRGIDRQLYYLEF